MTDTVTSSVADHNAELRAEIARLDWEIAETRREITSLQDEIDNLEMQRSDLLDELGDEED